ncbi:unnamed protein product, partial [Mesorhabditis belari]|uniref:AP-3 complex subunit beta n=1 Tax=Mesorhabditis belari TaxID=2138241 RepID=A0AAF3F5F6_9BILA
MVLIHYPTHSGNEMRMAYPESLTSPEVEIAEGGIMLDNKARFADLKAMLDSSKDTLKMDAMKRIIQMLAKGKDVSELFPAVVKNVAAKNLELKKLVYVYLVRYAEEQQDLALLSISTFQRALKDPNQLIRGSALRVLSSIRVGMIAPIMLLAIKDSVRDMSPYVRKVAAHAIPKLYALDSDLEMELVDCIDFLLGDRRSLVLGSAVYAFEEICPTRFDILHKHFRSLCRALADVDEWGQIVMINLLARYARSEFADPENAKVDADLQLLLASARPLLQSRSCAVVMAVTQLYYHCGPKAQLGQVGKALVRLLRGPREVQYVVLLNVATMCENQPNMFDPFLKSFFVRSSDPSFVKELKLYVMTSLVSESNVHVILRELQTYVSMSELAGGAVEAIGRCAVRVGAVSDSCMAGLIQLIASPNEEVVCAAVCVLKRLLHASAPIPLLSRLIRLTHSIQAPPARACVVWLVTTHVDKVIDMAPDLLRILAKNFANEHESVKVETLKLAVRLWMVQREKVDKLVEYVFQLARFDRSYDVRDRCRFLRNLLFNTSILSSHAEEIFLATKPAPALQSSFKDRAQFQLGSLSHVLNQRCSLYKDLPDFPEISSDATLRREANVVDQTQWLEEGEEVEEDDEDEDEDEEESDGDEDEEEDEGDEEDEDEEDDDEDSDENDSNEESSEESEEEIVPPKRAAPPQKVVKVVQPVSKPVKPVKPIKREMEKAKKEPAPSSAMDLLVDLDFSTAGTRTLVEPTTLPDKKIDLLNVVEGGGVEVSLEFARKNQQQYTPLIFTVSNKTDDEMNEVEICPPEEMDTNGERKIVSLSAGASVSLKIGADFGDSGRKSEWTLTRDGGDGRKIDLEVPLGEQLQPVKMSESEALNERKRLSGLNRHQISIDTEWTSEQVLAVANLHQSGDELFTGQTRSRKDLVIATITAKSIEVCCDNSVVGRMIAAAIQKSIQHK